MENCSKPATSGKREGIPLCSGHTWRKKKYGDPNAGQKAFRGAGLAWIEILLSEEDDGECRDWPYGLSKGRAVLRNGTRDPKLRVAHIVLERIGQSRPLPPFDNALHSCDRPICCAPWHLRWGSKKENYQDSVERDRNSKGESHGNAKLSEKDVLAIRSLYSTNRFSYNEIASFFNVEGITINRIINRESWKHI